jgi:GAF domain-containing protein
MEYVVPIIVAFITAVIGPSVLEWVRNKFKDRSATKSPIQEALELNERVDSQLEQLLHELECDRIWIAQFHNGGHFYPTGKSIQKFSIFYEKVSAGVNSIQHTYQNIPVSLFPKAFSKIYKDEELSIDSVTKDDQLYDLGNFARNCGTKSLYFIPIYSLNSHMIGILSISYNTKEYKLTQEDRTYIYLKAGAIGALLEEYLKTKKS